MRARLAVMFVATALLSVACGPGQDATPPASTTPVPSTTPQAVPVVFTYSYEPGDHHDYAFALDQNLQMTVEAEGDASLLGENPPEDINVATSIAGNISYEIGEGPEPGTRAISIAGVFDELAITGTVDGEPVDESEEGTVPDLVEVPDLTIVIDEHGNLVSVDGEEVPEDLALFGDPFSTLGDFTSGGLGGHFGPAFPDRPLAVGDSWSSTQSNEIDGLVPAVSVTSSYEVVGTETRGGHKVTVIDFTTETSEVEIDLGEVFQQLFDAFGELGSELGETTDTTAAVPEITFLITVAPSSASGTIWFDQDAGTVTQYARDTTTSIFMLMDLSAADGVARMSVTMDLGMQLTAELVEAPSA